MAAAKLSMVLLVISAGLGTARSAATGEPVVDGLSWDLYDESCPWGCDASVLLSGTNSEQLEAPNQTQRPSALKLIEDIRAAVHSACGPKVSCADITSLATRDAVVASGGPYFDVPLGRRDGLAPASSNLVFDLPAPVFDVPTLISSFNNRSLDKADLVALSGAHTIGLGHCSSFSDRLVPGAQPPMDPALVEKLKAKCAKDVPAGTVTQGIFTSDQGLIEHPETKRMATRFALNQAAFFDQYSRSMVKMSQMQVLTGNAGEIRSNCAAPNARSSVLRPPGGRRWRSRGRRVERTLVHLS
ncbi:hypothetical protein GUJ93_ZPchr0152g29209 [Zizania palustris]|uniref:Plant heme peroxidase family profile domain-containing protein n=1 Tax=Zizania palustris TaxID=103762 RepID=A0A8J5RF04_ZIZPA|nr:hypothetical protein GUJ93_ZPchr0152g29209 [Zizania palustris]